MTADVAHEPARGSADDPTHGSVGPIERRFSRLAQRLGCTVGQAYTAVIAILVALGLAAAGIPPTLRAAPRPPAAVPPPHDSAVAAPPVATPPPATVTTPPVGMSSRPAEPLVRQPPPPTTTDPAPALPAPPPGDAPRPAPPPPPAGTVTRVASLGERGEPEGIAVLASGSIAVGVTVPQEASQVVVLTAAGRVQVVHPIEGQNPGAPRIAGMTVLGDRLVVLDTSPARVLLLDPVTGEQQLLAALPDVLPCVALVPQPTCQPGAIDLPPAPRSVVVTDDGALLVTDEAQSTVWLVRPGADPVPWYQPESGTAGFHGIAVDTGRVLLSVRGQPLDGGGDALLAVAVAADGSAGEATELARAVPGEHPADVAVGASGKLYVALQDADAVWIVDRSGTEIARISSTDEVRFDAPVGLAVRDGSVLVTNRSRLLAEQPVRDVLAIAVDDRPRDAPATDPGPEGSP